MIKHILAAVVLFLTTSFSYSQNCTPSTQYTQPGIYPDSATNFVSGNAGSPYSQLITVIIPQDTTPSFPPIPIPWDSTVLVSITGLPNGFTYACWNNSTSPNRCSWKGNTTGCCIITGNPTINDTGLYNLTIVVDNYLGGSTTPIPYTITYYKIDINGPLSVPSSENFNFTVSQNIPNPAASSAEFIYTATASGNINFKLYDMVGNLVYNAELKAKAGTNKFTLDVKTLPQGIYMYSFSNGETTLTKRMVISR